VSGKVRIKRYIKRAGHVEKKRKKKRKRHKDHEDAGLPSQKE
jgi:hypothetical protein